MPIPFLALGIGGLAAVGSMQQQKASNQNLVDQAKQLGIRNAGIQFGAERQEGHIIRSMENIQAAKIQSYAEIQKAQARAESDAKVNAAASGVDGQSVEATINDTERSEANAKGAIDQQVKAQSLQLKTDYVDNAINAEMAKGSAEFRVKGKRTAFLENAVAFGQGFLGGL